MLSRLFRICLVGVLVTTSLLGGVPTFAQNINTSQCEYKKFRVTAYYSPRSRQDYFFQGDYDQEVRLNGFGTHGASGRPVHNGMLAGPASYSFGTNVYFPGRGVGVVGDRGQAIVEKGERGEVYDRIDIRVGEGEEGLQRALSFGVQYLDGYICPDGVVRPENVGFDREVFPTYDNFFEQTLWIQNLYAGRDDPWVTSLQDKLVALGYLDEESITGFFGRKTKAAVCAYQQKALLLPSSHESCGIFGPQTRAAMKLSLAKIAYVPKENDEDEVHIAAEEILEIPETPNDELPVEELLEVGVNEAVDVYGSPEEILNHHLFTKGEFKDYFFTRAFTKGEESKEIRILQRKLAWMGYYSLEKEITGVYDDDTILALYAFQLANRILGEDASYELRGFFGPSTRAKMNACGRLCVMEKE